MHGDDFVTLKQLADALNMDRSHARRYMLRNGFRPTKRRTADSGGNLTLTLAKEEADRLVAMRLREGFSVGDVEGGPILEDSGVFYVIQLVPELDPSRVKLGFAASVQERLAQHRTAAPTARLVKTWPCRRAWEQTAIAALTAAHCRLILNEVYECDLLEEFLRRADAFFDLLPPLDYLPPLADTSPLATTRDGAVTAREPGADNLSTGLVSGPGRGV